MVGDLYEFWAPLSVPTEISEMNGARGVICSMIDLSSRQKRTMDIAEFSWY